MATAAPVTIIKAVSDGRYPSQYPHYPFFTTHFSSSLPFLSVFLYEKINDFENSLFFLLVSVFHNLFLHPTFTPFPFPLCSDLKSLFLLSIYIASCFTSFTSFCLLLKIPIVFTPSLFDSLYQNWPLRAKYNM